MKLRKKLNFAGIISFFLGVITLFLSSLVEDKHGSVLLQIIGAICIFAAVALAVVCLIVKKRKRKKKKVRYTKSDRKEMAPYVAPEGTKESPPEANKEASDDRTYQVYTVTPRIARRGRKKHK